MSSLQTTTANLLLRAFSEADFALLEPHLERQQLKLKDPIFEPNEPIERIYFLEDGVASIVTEQKTAIRWKLACTGAKACRARP